MAKFILDRCREHEECVCKLTFSDLDDPHVDPAKDTMPIPQHLRPVQVRDFPDTFCTNVEHLPGRLDIKRSE